MKLLTENMKLFNHLFIAMVMLVCAVSSYAQKRKNQVAVQHLESRYMKLNSDVMQVYKELDSIFQLRYLANESPTDCAYWINYSFSSRDEFEKYKPWLESIMSRLQNVDRYSLTFGVVDSVDVYGRTLSAQLVTPNTVQKDQLTFFISNKRVGFFYRAMVGTEEIRDTGSPDDPNGQPRQDIADAMDLLLNEYINRKNVRADSVSYNERNVYYQYVSFVANGNGGASGVRYVVPNCTESDYAKFKNAIRSYAVVNPVRTSCNDMYWQYDASAIAIVRPDKKPPLIVAAELKGSDLYLVRAEGYDGMSFLPRAWAEEDPVWRMKDVYKLLARKPLDPPVVK